MTVFPAIIFASIIYSLYTYIVYKPELKTSSWVLWVGLALALAANAIWIFLAKNTENPTQLLRYGVYWDLMVLIVTLGLPTLMFDIKFSAVQWAGLALTASGFLLIKLGTLY